ncbi:MAG: hypothetical protein DRP70_13885, partial [Spirochaetes bacterium]
MNPDPGKISGPENTAAPDMIATETPKFPPGRVPAGCQISGGISIEMPKDCLRGKEGALNQAEAPPSS